MDYNDRAPGKLLLFGEHSAVYGYPALGMAIPSYLSLTARPNAGPGSDVNSPVGAASPRRPPPPGPTLVFPDISLPPEMIAGFEEHLGVVAQQFPGITLPPDELVVRSRLPVGSGFGSSAALCTVLARWMTRTRDPEVVWPVAHALEQFFHGTPSGIDTGLTVLETPQIFTFGDATLPRARPLTLPRLFLVVGSIPRERSTRELVGAVREGKTREPERIDALLRDLGGIASAFLEEPIASTATVGERANAAHTLLRGLGVSTPTMDRIITAGLAAGAAGGKLSGAGGGGAFYLVCSNAAAAEQVLQAVEPLLPPGSVIFTA